MGGSWFTEFGDELAQVAIDAGECAAACESLLEAARGRLDTQPERRLLAALVAPIATSRLLVELGEPPPQLLYASVQACRETSGHALRELEQLDLALDTRAAVEALQALVASSGALLDATR